MTTATTSHRAVAPTPRWSFGGVVTSEFTKLLTLRSTYVIALVMVGISVAFAALVASTFGDVSPGAEGIPAAEATASAVGSSVSFAQLVIGVLAVLLVTNEYATNMIQSSILSSPRRLPIIAAKLIVAGITTIVLSLVSSLASYAASAPILSSKDLLGSLGDGKVFGAMIGSVVYLLFVAVFSVAIGSLLRNSAAGIAVMAGVFFVLPTVLQLVAIGDFQPAAYMLGYAGQNVSVAIWNPEVEDLAQNIALTAAWLVIPTVAAFALFKKRDA